ncbi:MAG TPA: prepilin-type N-terminal cleavage/methylation domain-containing protein [Mycobacteriales bacterium]|nr:prepilin-type N-terminal cleavage/methylation domain-containing protein [Mycobacteriales bacterium]
MSAAGTLESADSGFTLTELLVSMLLFAIVGALVTTASITGLQRQTQIGNRDDAIAAIRTALERIDRDIRSAAPLLSASPTQLILNEVEPTLTRVMTYSVSGNELTVDQTTTFSDGDARTASHKVLLDNLVGTDVTPVFSFTSTTGYTPSSGSGVDATTCAMTGGAIDIGCVGTITVRLSTLPAHLAAPISLSDNGIDLRNAL